MTWRPAATPFRFILALLPLLALAVAAWLWTMLSVSAAAEDYGTATFLYGLGLVLALLLAGLLGYVAWCANTMSYRVDNEHLTLRYGGTRHVIRLTGIREVYAPGKKLGGSGDGDGEAIRVRWHGTTGKVPGYVVGSGDSLQLGRVVAVASQPAREQVFIRTDDITFGTSPRRALPFIDDLRARIKVAAENEKHNTGAIRITPAAHTQAARLLEWGAGLWNDRPVRWLLLLGFALCAAFFGWMAVIYSDLPIILPLHWNAQAQIDRVGDTQELLRLPAIALVIWLINTVLAGLVRPRERAATIILQASAVAVPVVFSAGALSIILRSM